MFDCIPGLVVSLSHQSCNHVQWRQPRRVKVKMNSLEIVLKVLHPCKASEGQEAETQDPSSQV